MTESLIGKVAIEELDESCPLTPVPRSQRCVERVAVTASASMRADDGLRSQASRTWPDGEIPLSSSAKARTAPRATPDNAVDAIVVVPRVSGIRPGETVEPFPSIARDGFWRLAWTAAEGTEPAPMREPAK